MTTAEVRTQALASAAQGDFGALKQLIGKLFERETRYDDIIEFLMRSDITEQQAKAYYHQATHERY